MTLYIFNIKYFIILYFICIFALVFKNSIYNMKEMEINDYRKMLIDYFGLINESVDSISKKLDFKFETKRRVSFRVTFAHNEEKKANALKFFGDEDGFMKYVKSLDGTIDNISAIKFIIYPKDEETAVLNQIKRLSRCYSWEYGDIGNGFYIAYD